MLQSIYISRITEAGVAECDGKLQVGDRIISVSSYYNQALDRLLFFCPSAKGIVIAQGICVSC